MPSAETQMLGPRRRRHDDDGGTLRNISQLWILLEAGSKIFSFLEGDKFLQILLILSRTSFLLLLYFFFFCCFNCAKLHQFIHSCISALVCRSNFLVILKLCNQPRTLTVLESTCCGKRKKSFCFVLFCQKHQHQRQLRRQRQQLLKGYCYFYMILPRMVWIACHQLLTSQNFQNKLVATKHSQFVTILIFW